MPSRHGKSQGMPGSWKEDRTPTDRVEASQCNLALQEGPSWVKSKGVQDMPVTVPWEPSY